MIGGLTAILSGIGRKAAFWGALAVAVVVAFGVAVRRGRHAAKADCASRRAEARIRSMQTAREVHHEVRTTDRADLDTRAERWMRD
jgi:hypothetical protein